VEFEEFARARLPGLVRFTAALTGDRQLAQDLVQDTMVRAFQKWGRVASAERPDLYLRRVVINGHLSWRQRWYQRTVRPVAPRRADVVGRSRLDRGLMVARPWLCRASVVPRSCLGFQVA
jgi:DNA-directed RNA polymerase specialized sigma24 family protein